MTSAIVVGAGAIGLFCAARLARAGVQVTVLEGEPEDFTPFAPTASLAAAGMLAPLSEAGDVAHPNFTAFALQSFDLWLAQSSAAPWADGVRFPGAALIANDAADAAAMIHEAHSAGRAAEPMSNWRKRTGIDARVDNAVFVEDEGVADPARVLSGLCMEARQYGALVKYAHDIEEVSRHRVVTPRGAFEADRVVLAPGAWATDALKAAAPALRKIVPAKGQLVPVTLARALPLTVHATTFYLAPRLANTVLGASMERGVCDRRINPERAAELLAAAERVLPGAVTPDGRGWAGVRPLSPDGAPMIGESGEVLVACGHGRNGWLLAPATAEIICALVLGDPLSPLQASFSPNRFETAS